MSTKLHVGNIPSVVLEDDLNSAFSQFGSVETVEIARDPVTGTSRGFAIVVMSKDEDASAAIARLNFTQYAGRTICVSRSRATRIQFGILDVASNDYEIVSVEPADPPSDATGTGWHCYVIQQGRNSIRGYQRGNIQFVTQAVEEIVARLNERRCGRMGRVHLVMSSPRKKTSSPRKKTEG